MAKAFKLLSSYCSPQESAFAATNPATRFASSVIELQKALDLINTQPGPRRPNARACGLLLAAAVLAKEDAYWGVAQAIEAMPAPALAPLLPVTFAKR